MRPIDADALKEYIGAVRAEFDFFDDDERPRYEAHSKAIYLLDLYVDSAPTIDAVSVVYGEWIKRHGTINCSVCKRSNWSACFEDTVRSFNFCPNCGAKMKGADDETDIS